jgi:tRNA/tmRNA/rRNA uracil-C5-methylase (TrmA/RlmC/RlmD family)
MKKCTEITKPNPQTLQKAKSTSPIRMKLKTCDLEIKNYVLALAKENFKLQKQIAKLQAENITLKNRVNVLEAEQYRPKANLIIDFGENHKRPPKK